MCLGIARRCMLGVYICNYMRPDIALLYMKSKVQSREHKLANASAHDIVLVWAETAAIPCCTSMDIVHI